MKVHIEKKEYKPLVERDEFIVKIEEINSTPSKANIKEDIAKLTNKPQEDIVVKKIYQAFGKKEAYALAYVYHSQEALKKFEPRKKEKKAQTEVPVKTGEKK